METSEALELAGIEITIVELLPQLLTFLDWEMAKIVENHVKSRNANVITQNGLAAFLGEDGKLTGVKLSNGTKLPCELAVVAIGINPNTRLARDAGIMIGKTGVSRSINTCRRPTPISTLSAIASASVQNEVSRVFDSLKDSTFLLAHSITATR